MPLFDAILESRNFTEKKVQKIVRKLFSAVSYLHEHNISHRDLKPENIIFDRMEEGAEPKLLDFGASYKYDDGVIYARIEEEAGTLGYKAPEMISGEPCSLKVDCWSMGVISYIMLCGFPPFFSDPTDKDNDDQLINCPFWFFFNSVSAELKTQILTASYSFPEKYWSEISAEAKDFVSSLLQVDPEVRLSAKQALHHKWHGIPELRVPGPLTTRVLSTQTILQKRLTSTNLLLEKDGRRQDLVDVSANVVEPSQRLTLRAAQRKWTSGLVDTVSFAVPGGVQDFSDSSKYFQKTPRHPRIHVNQISFQPPDPRKIDAGKDKSSSLLDAPKADKRDPRKIKRDLHSLEGEIEEGEKSFGRREKKKRKSKKAGKEEEIRLQDKDSSKEESVEGTKAASNIEPESKVEKPPMMPLKVVVEPASPRRKVGSNPRSPHRKRDPVDIQQSQGKVESGSAVQDALCAELSSVLDEKKKEEAMEAIEDDKKSERKKKTSLSSPFKKRN